MAGERLGLVSVFCSYAHEDAAVRNELQKRLSPLRGKVLEDWSDSLIGPGARWASAIEAAMERSRVFVFLISPDLMSSTYVRDVEIPKALERERRGHSRIVPIVVRPTEGWTESPLGRFQAVPSEAKPISEFRDPDYVYRDVVSGLEKVCKSIVDWENPYRRSQVGDWVRVEITEKANGQTQVTEGIRHMIARTDSSATVRVLSVSGLARRQDDMHVDLTRTIDSAVGEMASQAGVELPAGFEISLAPARHGQESLTIGGKAYSTAWEYRPFAHIYRGERVEGTLTTWRCIDVPLDGAVKMRVMRGGAYEAHHVLTDYGNADRPPPHLAGVVVAEQPAVGPGLWLMRVGMFGLESEYRLQLLPNGSLQGTQSLMGISAAFTGQWALQPPLLQLVFVTMMAQPESLLITLTGRHGPMLSGRDTIGRSYLLQRLG